MPHTDQVAEGRETNFQRRSSKTRTLIIEAACDVLSESGYAGLTASALVMQSGISKGGIYHHFDNMDEVVLAAYKKTTREVFTELRMHTPKSFNEFMGNVERLLFEGLFKNPRAMRIMHELLPRAIYDPTFGAKRQALVDTGIARATQSILGSVDGNITETELRITLQSVSIFLSGIAIHFQMTGNLNECKEMWASFRKMTSDKVDNC